MIEISVRGDNVLFIGKGAEFLRLKSCVLGCVNEADLQLAAKGQFALPLITFPRVSSALNEHGYTYPSELSELVRAANENNDRHLMARSEINKLIADFDCELKDEHWSKVLDPQQALGVRCMTTDGLNGMCLFDEQGAGKTVMSIAAFDILFRRGDVSALIVVCPKSMAEEWRKEFSRFLGDTYSVEILLGSQQDKAAQIYKQSDVLISNFEGFRGNLQQLKASTASRSTALIVDESFNVKNPDAIRSAACYELREVCTVAFCLCGTPAPNQPADIIHQFNIADGGFTFDGYRAPKDISQAKQQIISRIEERGVFLRRLKSELLPDLPSKSFHVRSVTLGGKQARLYEHAKDELVLYLRSLDNTRFRRELGTYFQKRSALLQICVDPSLVDPGYDEVPAKYVELDKIVESVIEVRQEKLVIWSYYTKTLDELMDRYGHLGVVRIDGTVSGAERGDAVMSFQSDPEMKIFIGNPAAAGAGITLHAASDAVYLSYSNQAAHYLQSLDRIHRRGQQAEQVNYHLLIASGTIEESELARLRQKEREQQELLNDNVPWPSSLDCALRELGAL